MFETGLALFIFGLLLSVARKRLYWVGVCVAVIGCGVMLTVVLLSPPAATSVTAKVTTTGMASADFEKDLVRWVALGTVTQTLCPATQLGQPEPDDFLFAVVRTDETKEDTIVILSPRDHLQAGERVTVRRYRYQAKDRQLGDCMFYVARRLAVETPPTSPASTVPAS